MKVNDLESALLGVIQSYSLRGFTVKHVLMDIQFECLKSRMSQYNVLVNVVSRDECVPEIERFIRLIMKRCHSSIAMLPFDRFLRCLIVGLLKTVIFYINVFPWPSGTHGIYADMKGIDGVFATEGKDAMYSSSTKLKLNSISLTKTEIVAVGKKLPKSMMWFWLYHIAQGGYVQEDILMQDNQS